MKKEKNDISLTSPNNIKYLLILKNNEIEKLKQEKEKNLNYIESLEFEVLNLKRLSKNNFELEIKLKEYQEKCSKLGKEIQELKDKILEITKNNNEEKRIIENIYTNQIIKYKKNESQKILTENKFQLEKGELLNEIFSLKKENSEINKKMEDVSKNQKLLNQMKINSLKQKLINNLNEAHNKVKELNIQYTDDATKLTILQNHQLLIQLEYQSKQIEEIESKNKLLNEKIYDLQRELEIHKEVELNLAEKNKKLNEKNKISNQKKTLNIPSNKLSINENSFESNFNYINSVNLNNNNIDSNNEYYIKYINLRKEKRDIEKKLRIKENELIELKEKNDLIENILKNYEKKYNGLFSYFEECLKLFFDDEDLKKNKNIFINIDSLKKGDFSSLSKDEKYSALIIIMKYLLPLINSSKSNDKIYNNTEILNGNNRINNINLKFHSMKKEKLNKKNNNLISKNLFFKRINRKIYDKPNSSINLLNSFQMSTSNYLPSISKIII